MCQVTNPVRVISPLIKATTGTLTRCSNRFQTSHTIKCSKCSPALVKISPQISTKHSKKKSLSQELKMRRVKSHQILVRASTMERIVKRAHSQITSLVKKSEHSSTIIRLTLNQLNSHTVSKFLTSTPLKIKNSLNTSTNATRSQK